MKTSKSFCNIRLHFIRHPVIVPLPSSDINLEEKVLVLRRHFKRSRFVTCVTAPLFNLSAPFRPNLVRLLVFACLRW